MAASAADIEVFTQLPADQQANYLSDQMEQLPSAADNQLEWIFECRDCAAGMGPNIVWLFTNVCWCLVFVRCLILTVFGLLVDFKRVRCLVGL